MRTLIHCRNTPNRLVAETLEIFAPIAHRLGSSKSKASSRIFASNTSNPEKYIQVTTLHENKNKNRQRSLDDIKKRIADIISPTRFL
jgi:GTP pyrophosphokinase